jgi:very-short-patch-repair endonuclease
VKRKTFARTLRKNTTRAEMYLWQRIRRKQLSAKFRRQQQIGDYIVDFVCFERKLIIEVDGGQHVERRADKIRDEWFENQGFKVIRFWNNDVFQNADGVLKVIAENISPSPLSPPVKGGNRGGRKPAIKRGDKGNRKTSIT